MFEFYPYSNLNFFQVQLRKNNG